MSNRRLSVAFPLTLAVSAVCLSSHADVTTLAPPNVNLTAMRAAVATNPKASALAIAALARVVRGDAPTTKAEQVLSSKLRANAKLLAAAARITGSFDAQPAAEKTRVLPGVDVVALSAKAPTTAALRAAVSFAAPPIDRAVVLPPASSVGSTPSVYQITYTGASCTAPAAPGGDTPAVLVFSETDTLQHTIQLIPASGTAVAGTHMPSPSTKPIFESSSFSNAGVLIGSAVLLDDVQNRRDEIEVILLQNEALTQASAQPPLSYFPAMLTYSLTTLQLANPARWSSVSIPTRLVTPATYATALTTPNATDGAIPYAFKLDSAAPGARYSTFFVVPPPPPTPLSLLKVTILDFVPYDAADATAPSVLDATVTVRNDSATGHVPFVPGVGAKVSFERRIPKTDTATITLSGQATSAGPSASSQRTVACDPPVAATTMTCCCLGSAATFDTLACAYASQQCSTWPPGTDFPWILVGRPTFDPSLRLSINMITGAITGPMNYLTNTVLTATRGVPFDWATWVGGNGWTNHGVKLHMRID